MSRYRSDVDRWIEARCDRVPGHKHTTFELYADYLAYVAGRRRQQQSPQSIRAFGDALQDRQILYAGRTETGVKQRAGLRLLPVGQTNSIEVGHFETALNNARDLIEHAWFRLDIRKHFFNLGSAKRDRVRLSRPVSPDIRVRLQLVEQDEVQDHPESLEIAFERGVVVLKLTKSVLHSTRPSGPHATQKEG